MNEYVVHMIHKMRSAVTVTANSDLEARDKARKESFDDQCWEEIDTEFVSIVNTGEVEIEEEEDE
jgi:hypothetical protein